MRRSSIDIEALGEARLCDYDAARDWYQHALAQSRYTLERRERITELLAEYTRDDTELLGVREAGQ